MRYNLSFEEFQIIFAEILGIDQATISADSLLYQDIGLDSLSMVNFMTKFEKQYEISIDPVILLKSASVGEFYNAIKELVKNDPVVY